MSDYIDSLVSKGKLKEAEEKIKRANFRQTDIGYQEIKPFTSYRTDEERAKDKGTRLTVRLNEEEIQMLKEIKVAINQPKDSTAIKTMFYLAYYNVIQDNQTRYLIATLFKNKKNNERTGAIVDNKR